ncbi:hypothetical protein ABZX41_44375, partial [Streptomyces sp. NPDC004533]
MPGDPLAAHPLSFLRQTRGWGKAEFARLMQAHGRSLGIPLATNRTTVWKWEQGQEPDADAQRVLADLPLILASAPPFRAGVKAILGSEARSAGVLCASGVTVRR